MPSSALILRWLPRILFSMSVLGWTLSASCDDLPEYRLKTAFIYNFAAFTEWPAEVGTTLNLCIYGQDPFGVEIDGLNGKTVGSRTFVVGRKPSLESLMSCQIAFITRAAIGDLPHVLATVHGLPILIVADSPGAARQGAALNMNLEHNRVTFEANLDAARAAGLNLSSKLLRLATDIIQ